jgi:hypothetical protein
VAAAGFFDLAAAAIGGSAPIWLHVRTSMASGLVFESNCEHTKRVGFSREGAQQVAAAVGGRP